MEGRKTAITKSYHLETSHYCKFCLVPRGRVCFEKYGLGRAHKNYMY